MPCAVPLRFRSTKRQRPRTSMLQSRSGTPASLRSKVIRVAPRASARATYRASHDRTRSRRPQARSRRLRCPNRSPGQSRRILHSLKCGGAVEAAQHVLAPDDAEDLRFDHVRRGLVGVGGQPLPRLFGGQRRRPRPRRGTRRRRRVTSGQGPRRSWSTASRTSVRVMSEGRRAASRQPLVHRGAGGQPRRLAAEQLRNGQPGFGSPTRQGDIHVVVDVANLNGLRHSSIIPCVSACRPVGRWFGAPPIQFPAAIALSFSRVPAWGVRLRTSAWERTHHEADRSGGSGASRRRPDPASRRSRPAGEPQRSHRQPGPDQGVRSRRSDDHRRVGIDRRPARGCPRRHRRREGRPSAPSSPG